MSETRNIVILGASFGGLSVAHYTMKFILPTLKADNKVTYKLCLVSPSSQFYWRIGAPRAAVSTTLIKHEDSFTPFVDSFKQYADGQNFTFYHAEAMAIDVSARTVTIKPNSNPQQPEIIPYHALVIATGSMTPTPLTSLHGDYTITRAALDEMNVRLSTAKTVVIGGGGPVGVETAGEVGEALNGAAPTFKSRPVAPKATITLVSGGKKLLPILRQALSDKAEQMLNRVGVDVVYNTRVESVDAPADGKSGKTKVHLSDGSTMEVDVYIPAVGATPNSSFLPAALRDDRGYIKTDNRTLRVEGAGERVYCIGDAGNYSRGGVMNLQAATPVLGANLKKDLLAADSATSGTPAAAAPDRIFKADVSETQVVPVGRSKGVGAFSGWRLPSYMTYLVKGKDYMLSRRMAVVTGAGMKE